MIFAAMLLLLLTACGNNTEAVTEKATEHPTEQPTEQPAAGAVAETRIFEHAKGSTEIPAAPKRVIAIQYTGAMLALGVKPVGGDDEWSAYPLLSEEWEGIEDVGDPWTGLNLEKIVELAPDLIVTHVEDTYEPLSKIAPTILIPWLQYDVREQITVFGDILGKQSEAESWLGQFDAKVEAARLKAAELIGAEETVAIVNIRPKNQFIYGDSAMGGYVLYQALGLQAPDQIQQEVMDQGKAMLEIQLEALPDYLAKADRIFVSVLEEGGGKERAEEVLNSEVWKGIPAVASNHVYPLDWNTYFTTDPVSTDKQLDLFIEQLTDIAQ
jgi:iron complex transport system substrate-binding protein